MVYFEGQKASLAPGAATPHNDSSIKAGGGASLFLPQLDGLRFFAFLAVFIHHSSQNSFIPWWNAVHTFGWIGVDLFFVISSFLFFHLLSAEFRRDNTIGIKEFYMRRFLRIFPLLCAFVVAMLLLFSDHTQLAFVRAIGAVFGVDNVLAWIGGYNGAVPHTAHLWTLSFEFQVYLVIPFAFIAYQKYGGAIFLKALLVFWVACCVLRVLVALSGAPHPVIWVSPILRPEAVLLGLALAIAPPTWPPIVSLLGAILALVTVGLLPSIDSTYGSIFVYPFTAVSVVLILDAALRSRSFANILSWTPIRFLGKISFGLYVFHLVAIGAGRRLVSYLGGGWKSGDVLLVVNCISGLMLCAQRS